MAEQQPGATENRSQSKIPRYIKSKSQIPTASVAYRETFQRVAKIKERVNVGRKKVNELQRDLQVRRDALLSHLKILEEDTSTTTKPKVGESSTGTSHAQVEGARRIIYTPGGSKRRGITGQTETVLVYIQNDTII